MSISTMLTKNSVTVNFDGKTFTFLAEDQNYAKIVAAIKAGDNNEVMRLAQRKEEIMNSVSASSNGTVEIKNGNLFIDGKSICGDIATQIVEFYNEGLPVGPLVNFYRKLQKNPSYRATQALFSFLQKNKHPITESGNFIAYKKVHPKDSSGRMLDIHSKTFDNSPGNTLSMPRNEVNEDPTQTCSYGLHASNWDYAANHFGSRSDVMIELEINPENVVAIPVDYNESKMRVCEYTVRKIVENPNDNKLLVREENSTTEKNKEDNCVECGQALTNQENKNKDSICEECEEADLQAECSECGTVLEVSEIRDCEGMCEDCFEELSDCEWCDSQECTCDTEEEEIARKNNGEYKQNNSPTVKQTTTDTGNNTNMTTRTTKTTSARSKTTTARPAVAVSEVPRHDETALRKMSTERLRAYRDRLRTVNALWVTAQRELVNSLLRARSRKA